MTEKIDVKGKNQHPLYKWLTDKDLNGMKNTSVKWNFQKYLVDDKGIYVDYFYSITKPLSSKITRLIK
jgi:glutathione peroxidase